MKMMDFDFGFNATFDEHKPHSNEEHRLQVQCVTWFRYQYPRLRMLLFSVPNGGYRLIKTATLMKQEGQLRGVSDLILLFPNSKYHALCIEMKTETGRQSIEQKNFQSAVEEAGYKYAVCRSLDDFMKVIKGYIDER